MGLGACDQETSLQVEKIVKAEIVLAHVRLNSGPPNAEFSQALCKKFYSEAIYFVLSSIRKSRT